MYRARPSATRRSLTTATARLQSLAEPPPPLSSREALRGPQGRSNLLFPRPASWLTLSGGPTILSVEFSLMLWALSSGGESAPLIRVRSVVRVHEGPPRRLRGRQQAAQSSYASPQGRGPHLRSSRAGPAIPSFGSHGEGSFQSFKLSLRGPQGRSNLLNAPRWAGAGKVRSAPSRLAGSPQKFARANFRGPRGRA